jgi:competence protein CoiA
MLCAKRKSDGQTVTAYMESKTNAPFFCLVCGDEVVLKTGSTKVNYFAHKNPLVCRFDANESAEHRQCKMEIYQALLRQPNVEKAAMERPLGTNRPDVSAIINGVPVAIEIQISSLSEETIKFRTMEYARKGIYVLWLLLWTPDLADTRYSPRLWEKWIHATYFGRVYYWIEGLTIVCYSFEPSLKSVPQKTWYSEKGKKITAGGYSRRSKRYRTAIRGETLNLTKDFIPKDRDWWEGTGITIPFGKLFMHRQRQSASSAG